MINNKSIQKYIDNKNSIIIITLYYIIMQYSELKNTTIHTKIHVIIWTVMISYDCDVHQGVAFKNKAEV